MSFEGPDSKVDVWRGNEVVEQKEPPVYVKRIFEIDGIVSIYVRSYSISLTKASVYKWENILERVIAVLNVELFPKSEPTEVEPPKKPSPEFLAHLRSQGCDV